MLKNSDWLVCVVIIFQAQCFASNFLDSSQAPIAEKVISYAGDQDEEFKHNFYIWLFSLRLTENELKNLWDACHEFDVPITDSCLAQLFFENGYADRNGFLYIKSRLVLAEILEPNKNVIEIKEPSIEKGE